MCSYLSPKVFIYARTCGGARSAGEPFEPHDTQGYSLMAKNVRGAQRSAVRANIRIPPIKSHFTPIIHACVRVYTKQAKMGVFIKSRFFQILPMLEKSQIPSQRGKKYLPKNKLFFSENVQIRVILDGEPIFVVKFAFNTTFDI